MERLRYERDDVLEAAIPASAEVERMGVKRDAIGVFAPRGRAATAYEALWAEVRQRVGRIAFRPLMSDPATRPTTSYEARPEDVHRVLLLYSGGLDTSVMLKWIQEKYDAEVVALTVNLGQPGEDYDVVRGKAQQLGALDSLVVDAREEFAREYVVRRSRPTRSTAARTRCSRRWAGR